MSSAGISKTLRMSVSKSGFSLPEWFKIVLAGLFLGAIFGHFSYSIYRYSHNIPIFWPINWCYYCICYSSFHLIEFFLTSIYRSNELSYNSFLLNQSSHYMLVTFFGVIEYWIEYYFIPSFKYNEYMLYLGLFITVVGIILRACAEIKMEANFSHVIRQEKTNTHNLVTTGIYSFFRHPSYTGWFYYLIGREVILQNGIGFLLTSFLFWIVLQYRIIYEEKLLREMFVEYDAYSKRTHICIPFMSSFCRKV